MNAIPAKLVPSRSKVVGSGTVAVPLIVVFGVKPVNVTVKIVLIGIPVPVLPTKKSIPLFVLGRPVKGSAAFTGMNVPKKGKPFPVNGPAWIWSDTKW